jgi:hypothetical protein
MVESLDRRAWLGRALIAGAVVTAPTFADAEEGPALGARSHFYAKPQYRQALSDCFTKALGCPAPRALTPRRLAEPILAFSFPGGGSVSVEFTSEALDPAEMRHGAWLEIRSSDSRALQHAVLAAGLPQVTYAATNGFYFAAPGGQVFGIVRAQPGA